MKTLGWYDSRGYNHRPLVSFLIETHNLSGPAVEAIRSVRGCPNSEIVVIDDGSDASHSRKIADELRGVNEFYLRFNDLFCVITQNRAIPFCKGNLVVKMQDDDKYSDKTWVKRAIEWFIRFPDLGVLGGRRLHPIEPGTDFASPTKEPIELNGFMFAGAVNESPMWIRRSAFMRVGGFDEAYAPFQWGEAELCYKMWLAGYSVAWYPSGVEPGAILTTERRVKKRRLEIDARKRNRSRFMSVHQGNIAFVNQKVFGLNALMDKKGSPGGETDQ